MNRLDRLLLRLALCCAIVGTAATLVGIIGLALA